MNGNSPAFLACSNVLPLRQPGFARRNHSSFKGLLATVVRQACHELRLRCYRRVRFRSRAQDEVRHAYRAMEVWEFEGLNARQAWSNWRTIPRNLDGRAPARPLRALDLCCGTGQSTEVLAYYLAPGSRLLGLENSPRFVVTARARTYTTRNGSPAVVEFGMQSVLDTFRDSLGEEIPDASVDLVNSSGAVGCHFAVRDTALLAQEVARVLRGGGLALIDSGRAGTSERELVEVFTALDFQAIHRARSCALDRYTQVCFRKLA